MILRFIIRCLYKLNFYDLIQGGNMAKQKTRRRKKRTKRTGKSISLGNGFKFNLSKSGVNISGGIKGARFSLGNKGLKSRLSIPGTGISKTKTLVSAKDIINKFDDEKDSKNKSIKKDTKEINKEQILDETKKKDLADKKDSLKKDLADKNDSLKSDSLMKDNRTTSEMIGTDNPNHESIGSLSLSDLKPLPQETFQTGFWIALVVMGAIVMVFNVLIGAIIAVIGGFLIFKEYQFPKSRAKRYYNIGVELYKQQKYDLALKEMEKAVLFYPDHEWINIALAKLFIKTSDAFEKAIAPLEKAVRIYKNKEAILLLSHCYFEKKDYVQTIELLKTQKFKNEWEKLKLITLARSYIMLDKPTEAITILLPSANEYVINKDELIDINYWLGYAYLDNLEYERAEQYLRIVFEQNSEYLEIQRLMEKLS